MGAHSIFFVKLHIRTHRPFKWFFDHVTNAKRNINTNRTKTSNSQTWRNFKIPRERRRKKRKGKFSEKILVLWQLFSTAINALFAERHKNDFAIYYSTKSWNRILQVGAILLHIAMKTKPTKIKLFPLTFSEQHHRPLIDRN